MLSRNRFRGGAVVGASALFALVYAWRAPSPAPLAAEVEAPDESSDREQVAPARPTPAAPAWSSADAPAGQPNVEESRPAPPPSESVPSRRARRAARAHLRTLASEYGLERGDVDALEHRDTYVGDGAGARVVRFRQTVGGRPVVGREVSVVLNVNDEPVGVMGRLAPSAALRRAELAEARAVRTSRDALSTIFGDPVRALPGGATGGLEDFTSSRAGGALERARVRRVLYDRDGELVPAHQVEVELRSDASREPEATSVIVSAIDGTKLHERSLVHADTFRVFADRTSREPHDSPAGTEPTPHPTGNPDQYSPAFVPTQLVTLSNQHFSRNDPWLPPGATSLSGNSVFAYVDRAAPSGFDPALDLDIPPTAPASFDYTYDASLSPTVSDEQSRAAAMQAFYVTSYLHDIFYDYGFDEIAGNAQASNLGRGGMEGDRLIVAAQAHALESRSLAVIPPDGSTPRLSFGIYKGQGGRPDRDGAVDSTLVAHEWGHLLAERLVGNAIGLGNPQGRAISEGTADLVALLLVIRPEDVNVAANANFTGVFPVGSHAASASSDDAYYFGLRRVPYSANLSRNALTFRHVVAGASLPVNAPMRASDPADNSLPHNAGEVWATALMDCYVSLLRAHPFEEARNRMRQYLVAGLRVTPFEPTFTEAARALRMAAGANDPADEARFTAAFAKRGLGLGAMSPSRTSTDLVGVEESWLNGASFRVLEIALDDSTTTCDADGILDRGEVGRLRVTVENTGPSSVGLYATVATDTGSAPLAFLGGNQLHFNGVAPGGRVTASIPVALQGDGGGAPARLRISFDTPTIPSSTMTFEAPVDQDERVSSTTDTMSTRTSTLAFEQNGVRAPFVATRDASDDFAHVNDGPARGTHALVTGPLTVTSQLGVSFRMRHSLVVDESSAPLDGAIVEISEDGVHFEDVTKSGASAGYGGSLAAGTTNPIGARPAYTGMSAGFPAFVTRTIDLGNTYVGKSVVLRFRVGAAGSNKSAYGLDIDDLTVTGVAGAPFAGRVAETSDGTVCNRPPIADAGDDVAVTQFSGDPALGVPTVVSLSAAESFDPDGAALSFAWTQLSGPAVALASDTTATTSFAVPAIKGDTVFVFQVAVSDGVDTTTDTVRVAVRRDNRAPTAVAEGPDAVASGATVVLDGALSSDPDGDALTYAWKQTAGPAVTLTASDATATFTSPVVDSDTMLTFSLEVSDGIVTSAPVSVEVTVRASTKPDAGGPPPAGDAGDGTSSGGPPGADEDAGSSSSSSSSSGGPRDEDDGEGIDGDDADGGCAAAGARGRSVGAPAWALALALGFVMRRRRRGGPARR